MTMLQRLLASWRRRRSGRPADNAMMAVFKARYASFKELLQTNAELLQLISDIEEKLSGKDIFGMAYIRSQSSRCVFYTARMIQSLEALAGHPYPALGEALKRIRNQISRVLDVPSARIESLVLPYREINRDLVDFVGGKNANLGEVLNRVHMPIPRGFAITTAAFRKVLEAGELADAVGRSGMEIDIGDPQSILAVSRRLQDLLLGATLPTEVVAAIREAHHGLAADCGRAPEKLKIAMRSSAIGEDSGGLSFAGQYLSELNVPADRVLTTYKAILASLYTPRAITYRLHRGIPVEDISMSVACTEMVAAKASGVMYSRHPFHILEDNIIINAVWGLGPYAVDGKITPDAFTLSKEDLPVVLGTKVARKPARLESREDGGLVEVPVEAALQRRPCLNEDQLKSLARFAMALERHFQCPQDVEWALDEEGRLLILQSRPLMVAGRSTRQKGEETCEDCVPGYRVMLSGGDIACPGVGCGPAHIVRTDEDLLNFPDDGVLIAESPNPKYLIVMPRAQAILTDSGSITGHMASLAREFMVPALLNTGRATKKIVPPAVVTVDAYSGRVYEGKVPELLGIQLKRGNFMKDSPVYGRLQKVAQEIVPLNLIDPGSPEFQPRNCRTVHDIMRLAHEFSYKEIFQFSDLLSDVGRISYRLEARLPLDLHIIDLGDGLENVAEGGGRITVEQVASVPFSALLRGMLREDLISQEPRPVNIKGFLAVMSEQILAPPNVAMERFGDRSYAIISDKYLNFSSRVGYHYSVVDAYCGRTVNKNYVNFQFKGGAADDVRRGRRSRGIGRILEKLGFRVDIKADVVTARLQKRPQEEIDSALDQLGRLLQYTRQMDMLMHGEESVSMISECFLNGDYQLCRQRLENGDSSTPKAEG
jgi:pyruvate,water dikinase